MPSVWFINPRIVANLKALATREMKRGERKERESVEMVKKGGGRARRGDEERRREEVGEQAKTRGRESTQDLGR